MSAITFTILGQPQSKANSRVLSTIGPKDARRTILRKSNEALQWESDALRQIPPKARLRLEGQVSVTIRIWYASERPDLDESLVLDVLQDRWSKKNAITGKRELVQAGVYRNDRQVREKHVFHAIDRRNPRVDVVIEAMQVQQEEFAFHMEPRGVVPAEDLPF
jgi:Holliday junction resolvase RusA-like endonuclease